MESELIDRTYNNRVGKGGKAAINQLSDDIREVTRNYREKAWIIGQDVRGCFPNSDLDMTYRIQRDIIERRYEGDIKDDLLYILRAINYAYPARHCMRTTDPSEWSSIPKYKSLFEMPPSKGGIIGSLYWQFAVGFNFNVFDHEQMKLSGVRYVRFVDDMRWIVPDEEKDAFLNYVIPEQRKMLASFGMEMHPNKFFCQPCDHGTNFIGRTIKMSRIYPSRRIVRMSLRRIAKLNRKPCEKDLEHFLSSVNAYLGIFKTCNGYNLALKLIGAIAPGWLDLAEFDAAKTVMRAREGYRHWDILQRRYRVNLKIKGKWKRKHNYRKSSRGDLNCDRSCAVA